MYMLCTAIFSQLSIMYYLKVVVFSLCVVAVSCAPTEPSADDMLVVMNCMKEKKIPLAEIEKFGKNNPTENQKCVMGCAYKKFGFATDIEGAVEKLGGSLSDTQGKTLAKCYGDIKATDDCELGKELLECDKKAEN